MSGYGDRLAQLGVVIPNELGIDRVLQSLPPCYKSFVMNYNMHARDGENSSCDIRSVKDSGGGNQEGASSIDGQQDNQFQEEGLERQFQEGLQVSCCACEDHIAQNHQFSTRRSHSTKSSILNT